MTPAQRYLLAEVRALARQGRPFTLDDGRRLRTARALEEAGHVTIEGLPYWTGGGTRLELVIPAGVKRRVTCRKHGGDDRYSWATFVDGRLLCSGDDRYTAQYEVRRQRRMLAALELVIPNA